MTETDILNQFQGLTDAQAEAIQKQERTGDGFVWAQRTYLGVLKQNVFTIFNITMLVMAVSQVLLDDLLGALLTLLVLLLGFGVNMLQQLLAAYWLRRNTLKTRHPVTVIREEQIRSIKQDQVVPGDVIIVGPGDEIIADGELLSDYYLYVDEVTNFDDGSSSAKKPGEQLQAGSYCVRGWGVYRVGRLPSERLEGGFDYGSQVRDRKMTPLQLIINRILRTMLVASMILFALLVVDLLGFGFMPPKLMEVYRGIISIIFSIAPSGLLLTIIVSYTVGSAFLTRPGALVRDARAVETLAQLTTLCVNKGSILVGGAVEIKMILMGDGEPYLPENRVRQILGDISRSTQVNHYYLRTIASSMEGQRLPVDQEADYLSILGWGAVTFTGTDMRGTYVIGYTDVLFPFFLKTEGDKHLPKVVEKFGEGFKQTSQRLVTFFQSSVQSIHRSHSSENDKALSEGNQENVSTDSAYRRSAEDKGDLIFAYTPEPQHLFDPDGHPVCPADLRPLCSLRLVEQVSKSLIEEVDAFQSSGVTLKILSSDRPENVLTASKQIGLSDPEAETDSVFLGAELDQMSNEQGDLISGYKVFACLNPEQKAEVVRGISLQDEFVGVVGDRVSDLKAMQVANMGIAGIYSSQIVQRVADIVILKDNPGVLSTVLHEGQRIVNGVMDMLKLNLTQVTYVFIMLLAMYLLEKILFFYDSAHNGVIYFVTVLLPSLSLSLFAPMRAVNHKEISWRLAHFIIPAGITMSIAGLVVYTLITLTGSDLDNIQQSVMHAMIVMGLILVVFVQPPTQWWVGGAQLSGRWWPTILVVVEFFLFQLVVQLPLVQEILKIRPLNKGVDYIIVFSVSIIWLLIVRLFWRRQLINRGVEVVSKWLAGDQDHRSQV